jgi:hypothetical protein
VRFGGLQFEVEDVGRLMAFEFCVMYIIVCWNSVIVRDGRSNEQRVLKEGAEDVELQVDLDQYGRKEALERAIERSNITTVFIEKCSMLINRKE